MVVVVRVLRGQVRLRRNGRVRRANPPAVLRAAQVVCRVRLAITAMPAVVAVALGRVMRRRVAAVLD